MVDRLTSAIFLFFFSASPLRSGRENPAKQTELLGRPATPMNGSHSFPNNGDVEFLGDLELRPSSILKCPEIKGKFQPVQKSNNSRRWQFKLCMKFQKAQRLPRNCTEIDKIELESAHPAEIRLLDTTSRAPSMAVIFQGELICNFIRPKQESNRLSILNVVQIFANVFERRTCETSSTVINFRFLHMFSRQPVI